MILISKWILPISSPPIENGVVEIEGDRIKYVGVQQAAPLQDIIDLGDSVLFPGLVNAHGHLEFSHLKNQIKPRGSFSGWVREMMRVGVQNFEPLQIHQLIHGGTTTIADHCNPGNPETAIRAQQAAPLRRIPFWEVLGASQERAEASYQKALERVQTEGGFITPHSLYGVHPEILNQIASPLQSIHFLESAEEDEWFRKGTGALAELVKERGGVVGAQFIAPLRKNTLLIHANYVTPDEIRWIKEVGAGVVHCPGSHQYFGHKRFPLEELQKSGIPIALGTDSLASNEELSMLREMRLLQNRAKASDILEMATLNGAKLLGMEKEIGSIEVGKKADLVAVSSQMTGRPEEAILNAEEVSFCMIDGKIIHV